MTKRLEAAAADGEATENPVTPPAKALSKRRAAKSAKARPGSKPARSKSARKKAAVQRLITIEDARQDLLRMVCLNSEAITQAVIDEALQGKYLSAKFLFDAVGLCPVHLEKVESATEEESLASLLLQRFGLAVSAGPSVTEVAVTAGTGVTDEAPVEL
jgi:hypothetical protein